MIHRALTALALALALAATAHADEGDVALITAMARAKGFTGARVDTFSAALVAEVDDSGVLFSGDDARARSFAIATAIGINESSLQLGVEGDCKTKAVNGKLVKYDCQSGCWGGVQFYKWTRAVLTDGAKCMHAMFVMIRDSFRRCRAYPLAIYAGGNDGCGHARSQWHSNDRFAVAKWMLAEVRK